MKDQSSDDNRISEAKASRVLDRAAQLDAARGREVSVQELREAALEAGISPEAFERAVAELRAAKLEPTDLRRSVASPGLVEESASPRTPDVLYRAGLFAAGLALGGLALLLSLAFGLGDAGIIFSLLIAAFVALGLMFKRRSDGSVLDFELDLVMLWLGLTLILMLGDVGSAEDVLANMGGLGALWALGGGAAVALAPAKRPKELPEET